MGFDVSWHPIDEGLIRTRLLPYLRGEGDIGDLAATAANLAAVRSRAKAIAVAVCLPSTAPTGLFSLEKNHKDGGVKPSALKPLPGFTADVHLQGRPFLLLGDDINVKYAEYLNSSPDGVEAIAHRELGTMPVPEFTPAGSPTAEELIADLTFLRNAFPLLKGNKPVTLPDGEIIDAEDLYLFNMPTAVVTFAAALLPGWMGRGPIWFTQYLDDAKLDPGVVETAATLFESILDEVPDWRTAFEPTITHNYMLGGYVNAANLPAFHQFWLEHETALIAPWIAEKDGARGRHGYTMIREALALSEARGCGFLEATEIYSGFLGLLN